MTIKWSGLKCRQLLARLERAVSVFIVPFAGISQVITDQKLSTNSPDRIKQIGYRILQALDLTQTVPASGVIFTTRNKACLSIKPVVWVKGIKTLFYETACASGTTAVAIVEALKLKRNLNSFPILQPSGISLLATVRLSRNQVTFTEIGGPVREVNP